MQLIQAAAKFPYMPPYIGRGLPRPVTIPREMLAAMAADYLAHVAARPVAHRPTFALMATVRCVGVAIETLRSHPDTRPIASLRQQAMTFARVISEIRGPINTHKKIAAAFQCRHSNVLHACKVYGDSMREELTELL